MLVGFWSVFLERFEFTNLSQKPLLDWSKFHHVFTCFCVVVKDFSRRSPLIRYSSSFFNVPCGYEIITYLSSFFFSSVCRLLFFLSLKSLFRFFFQLSYFSLLCYYQTFRTTKSYWPNNQSVVSCLRLEIGRLLYPFCIDMYACSIILDLFSYLLGPFDWSDFQYTTLLYYRKPIYNLSYCVWHIIDDFFNGKDVCCKYSFGNCKSTSIYI